MRYEVVVRKHFDGTHYNVDLVSWDRGEGVGHGRAFKVSRDEAQAVAEKSAKLYDAEITWEKKDA